LLLRRRPLHVERRHQHFDLAAVSEAQRDLGGSRRLARALQADEHDRHRRGRVEIDRLAFAAERLDQRIVDDLDHHLARRDRLDHRRADRLRTGAIDERADDFERNVGLEQRTAHFAHRRVDVLLGEGAAAGQSIQYAGELLGKALEHGSAPVRSCSPAATPIAPGSASRRRTGTAGLRGRTAYRRGRDLTKTAGN